VRAYSKFNMYLSAVEIKSLWIKFYKVVFYALLFMELKLKKHHHDYDFHHFYKDTKIRENVSIKYKSNKKTMLN
jgi:hypothetical protein